MSLLPVTISKQPPLKPALDYFGLRREGIGFIAEMGSSEWTDYNTHDPGITILEALCYAITDLAYRVGWDIKDLLATHDSAPTHPFPHQAFLTARKILTVNPWTEDDFRRILIDLDLIRNAWVHCTDCACGIDFFVWCQDNQLVLSRVKPLDKNQPYRAIAPKGLYEVLLELEEDPELGDLNDRKIEQSYQVVELNGTKHAVTIELRFPEFGGACLASAPANELQPIALERDVFQSFAKDATINLVRFDSVKNGKNTADWTEVLLREMIFKNWRNVFYASVELTPLANAQPVAMGGETMQTVAIENIAVRIYGDSFFRSNTSVLLGPQDPSWNPCFRLIDAIEDPSSNGVFANYRRKLAQVAAAVSSAKATLHQHRNLDEDFCHIARVEVEDIAVCADIDVAPDADIERVQAQLWLAVETYLNPPVPFHALPDLMNANVPVETIFNGPALRSGFIVADELRTAELRQDVRTSDIISRLLNGHIEGLVAVNNLLITKYDNEGVVMCGDADPQWTPGSTSPQCDPKAASAAWVMRITSMHQPRLNINLSRFLFYKNGLPFLARADEARDTLIQLRGESERLKIRNAVHDIPLPVGTFRKPADYFPVQYSFPLTYGIGTEGLPGYVSDERRGQAKQLKAYLMVFEQLLSNAHTQLAHVADLFSLSTAEDRTYFFRTFTNTDIAGFDQLNKLGSDAAFTTALASITESPSEFLERRNRFLNHLMARFGEQFEEYVLLLTDYEGTQTALTDLISDKIAFLENCGNISHNRAKAFNYKFNPLATNNVSQLKERINLLLGKSGNARMIIVEHLLLRPKFPGDALYPLCSDAGCGSCCDDDPYSFRLTFVVPGWEKPFSENMSLRRFAERTIQQETPSHLLPKICWVGNNGLVENPCEPIVEKLAELLQRKGKTTEGNTPSGTEACGCAGAIYHLFCEWFAEWHSTVALHHMHPEALKATMHSFFSSKEGQIPDACPTINLAALWSDIVALMNAYFEDIAVHGMQFERFEQAWTDWLQANSAIDWMEERLHESVVSRLAADSAAFKKTREKICSIAESMLMTFGTAYFTWMTGNINSGNQLSEFTALGVVDLNSIDTVGFDPSTITAIHKLLAERYASYTTVSFRLHTVVNILCTLRNIYPGATLHDCDDGSDLNPVRLGSTALGNYPLRQTPTQPANTGG